MRRKCTCGQDPFAPPVCDSCIAKMEFTRDIEEKTEQLTESKEKIEAIIEGLDEPEITAALRKIVIKIKDKIGEYQDYSIDGPDEYDPDPDCDHPYYTPR